MQQRNQRTILLLDLTIGGAFSAPIVQPVFIIFVPGHKVFSWCTASTIQHLVRIDGHYKLRVTEQVRDVFFPPVPDVLRHALHDVHTGFFALDYNKRNAIYQHNNIRTSKFAVRSFYFKLIGHLEGVILRVVEVDIADIKRLASAIREIFFHAFSGTKKLINLLVGSIESSRTVLIYRLHGLGNRATGEKSSFAAELIGLLT